MTCIPGHRFNIHAMLQEVGDAGVPKAMAALFFNFLVSHMKNVLPINDPVSYGIAATT